MVIFSFDMGASNGFTTTQLNDSIGVRFIGMTFHLMLDGFVAAQAWTYFTTWGGRGGDPVFLQLLAGFVSLATLIGAILIMDSLYNIHVLNFLNPEFIFKFPASFGAAIFVGSLVAACVQAAFVGRCYRLLGRPKWMWYAFTVPIAWTAIGSLAIEVYNELNRNFKPQTSVIFKGLFLSWLGNSTAIDLGITGILLYRFRDLTEDLYFEGTKNILVRYMLMSMTTCFVTTSIVTITFILYFVEGPRTYHLMTYEVLASLYAASLFVQLTSRRRPAKNDIGTASQISHTTSFVKKQKPVYSVSVSKYEDQVIDSPTNGTMMKV